MRFIFFTLCLICTFLSYGQEELTVANLSEKDSLIFIKLKQQFAKHINPNPDSSLIYAAKIKEFSKDRNYSIGLVEARYFKAFYFRRIQKLDSAVVYFDVASKLAKKYDYLRGIALAENGLCRVYYFLGQTDNALDACTECLDVAKKMNDLAIMTDTYTAFGNTYSRQNDMKKAIHYYLKADSIHTITPQRPDVIAATYQSLGTIYGDLKDYDTSIEYFEKANDEFKKIPADVTFYLNTTDFHLGTVYYHKGNLKLADSLLQKTYTYFKEIKEENSVAQISTYLGLIRLNEGELEDAERFLIDGFELQKNNDYSYETAMAALELGKLYISKKDIRKAIYYLNELQVNYSDDANTLVKQEALLSLSKAYALKNDYTNAYKTLEQTFRLKDSINSIQSLASIKEIDTKYQTEKKEQEIVLLKSQNELVKQQKLNQRNQLLGGIALTSLLGLFFFLLFRNRQQTNNKLKELDKIKSNFFANISHEFRTPLTLISGPIQKLLGNKALSEGDKKGLIMVNRNTNRLLTLVDELLDISKIESGSLKLNISKDQLIPFVGTLTDSFTYKAERKKVNYTCNNTASVVDTWFDRDIIEKVIVNLISNAIKYTPEKGSIECDSFVKNDIFYFEVKNTGNSLSKEEQTKIFDRFYQVNDSSNGVGIGLALVKQLVKLNKGFVSVQSIENKWIIFNVQIPVSKYYFEQHEFSKLKNITQETEVEEASDSDLSLEKLEKDANPILLIVDDNEDIRTFVEDLFKDSFTVFKANDGDEGVLLALKHVPDIIICDIMMPIKTGIELCNDLKYNRLTSHIPIILLTAKSGDENKLEGLKTGADAYITKPFNNEILIVRVKNLIESREQLQQRYSQEVVLQPKDIAITNLDEEFLEHLQKILDEKLVESSFSIEQFSKALGMSRMQLHRKLKALTGLSASEFIRSQRLKLASKLLKNSDVNVSQIGYSVGFNDHAYFSKCFKEMYNCTPSEYVHQSH